MGKRIEVTPYRVPKAVKKLAKAASAPVHTKTAKKAKARHADPLKALEAIRKSRREAMARYRANLRLAGSGGMK